MTKITTEDTPQLSINKLKKGFYIIEGEVASGTFKAEEDDPLLYLDSDLTSSNRVLSIKYEKCDSTEWMDYELKIEALPSNLGKDKGLNFYFTCPISGKRAKILYYDSETHFFVHREALSHRLYYPMQTYGKVYRIYENVEIYEAKLVQKYLQLKNESYNGRATKTVMMIRQLYRRRDVQQVLMLRHMKKSYEKWEVKIEKLKL